MHQVPGIHANGELLSEGRLTSMEQKIHKISVCSTVNAAAPTPNAK